MKKLFTILAVFFAFVANSQTPYLTPYTVVGGGQNAGSKVKGGLFVDSTSVQPRYRDTLSANRSRTRLYPGSRITVGNVEYYRSQDTSRWILGGTLPCPETGLISGSATWTGDTLAFDVTNTQYIINCNYYGTLATTIILANADPTNPRIDLIIVDTNEVVSIIQGTPSANPIKPTPNALSQLELTFVYVPAGSVTPPQVATIIYNETCCSWAPASNISGIDFAYPTNPYDGLVSTLVPLMTAPFDFLSYQNGSVLNINNYQYLKLYLRRNSALGSDPPSELIFTFYNGATQVTSSVFLADGSYGYDGSVIGSYQLITIPISAFTLADSLFDKLYITNTFGSLSSFQLDKIYILGSVPPPPVISNSWVRPGNASTNPATDRVGTTDSTQLNIGANGRFDLIVPAEGINFTPDTSTHILVRDPITNKLYWIYQPSIYALGCLKIYDSTSAGITRKYIRDTCSSGGSGTTLYTWVEQFDDAIIGANQPNGINKFFTITNTPYDSLVVFKNGLRMKKGQNYTFNGTTGITFIDTVFKKDIIVASYNYTSVQPTTNRYYQGQTNNIVYYGNSLFYGVGAVHGFSDAVKQESNFLPTVGFHNVNRGVNGITTPQLTADITDSLVPYLSTSYASNIILVCEGTNQIAGGASAATAYADLVTLCNTIKGLNASYKVIICTILPGNPTVDETKRLAVNANIVANYATFADGLVDFSTNSYIGDAGDNRNQTYYTNDSLHLRPEGYYQMASTMYAPIMAQAGIATQNITRVLLPQNNEYAVIGGNYSDTATANMIIGTQRPIQLSFMTDAKQRGRFDSIGRFIVDATITTRTPSDTLVGVNLKPNITGNNAGTVYDAVQIGGTFSNFNNANFFQLRIKDNNSSTIIEVPSVKTAYSTANLYALRGFNTNIISPALTINSDLNLTNFTTGGLVFSTGGTPTTGNATVIGYNGNKLIYNLAIADAHSFRTANTERFAVGFNNQIYGGYGANISATNSFNYDAGVTTGGFIYKSPGGPPVQSHLSSTNSYEVVNETASSGLWTFRIGSSGVNFRISNTGLNGIIPSGVGTKSVRYNPSTGDFSYGDTTTAGGGGTVTSVSGTAGRIDVATGTTTPVIDISPSYTGQTSINTLGTVITGVWNGTAIANTNLANSSLTIGSTNIALGATSTTLAGLSSVTSTSFVGALTGNASTVTTNANLTGVITSVGNATSIASQTGTGTKFVVDNTPTLIMPILGVATATSINKVTITAPTTSATLTLIDGSSLITAGAFATTLTSTATTNATLPAGTSTLYGTLSGSITSSQLLTSLSDETGTGSVVGSASPVGTGTWTIPTIVGGSTTTSPLILYATTGTAAAGASVIFKGGTNGGTTFTTMSSTGAWDFASGAITTNGNISGNSGLFAGNVRASTTGQIFFNSSSTIKASTNGFFEFTNAALTANSSTMVFGGMRTNYVAKTANYTATVSDYTIECTANTFQVTLPTAVGAAGQIYNISNSGAGTITIGTTSSQTFVNVVGTPTTLTLATVGNVTVQSNGANWLQLK